MEYFHLFGYAAAVLTTVAFLPQVIKTWKQKSAKDISLGMYIIFISGVTCWFIYGVLLENLPMILANVVTLILAGFVLYFKLTYDKNEKEHGNNS